MASKNETQERETRTTPKQFAADAGSNGERQLQSRERTQTHQSQNDTDENRSVSRPQSRRRELTRGGANPLESL